MTYTIWKADDVFTIVDEGNYPVFNDGTPQDPDAKLVKVIEAESREEAFILFDKFLDSLHG